MWRRCPESLSMLTGILAMVEWWNWLCDRTSVTELPVPVVSPYRSWVSSMLALAQCRAVYDISMTIRYVRYLDILGVRSWLYCFTIAFWPAITQHTHSVNTQRTHVPVHAHTIHTKHEPIFKLGWGNPFIIGDQPTWEIGFLLSIRIWTALPNAIVAPKQGINRNHVIIYEWLGLRLCLTESVDCATTNCTV